jgi:DHA1 family multidrug resistance protein-like MFS transporter
MLTATMFLTSFAWALVYVALPFHIEGITTVGSAATLAWTGWILGITSLGAVVSGPVWSRFADRRDPKAACVSVYSLQSIGFLATGLARSLPELFLTRLALGAVGSASTFAFLLAGRTPDPAVMRRRLAAVQSAIMVGQVLGPLPGALAAARLGFRLTFFLGGLILATCGALLQWGMAPPSAPAAPAAERRHLPVRRVVTASALVLLASSQETFLAAVLPRILPGLGVAPAGTLEAAGLLLFASGAAAAVGGLAAPYLAEQISERRALAWLLGSSSIGLVLLTTTGSLWSFTLVRVLQSLCMAPFFPLVVARVARHGGDAIGIVNAARIGSGFLGPLVATTLLAAGPPALLYAVLGGIGLVAALRLRRLRF